MLVRFCAVIAIVMTLLPTIKGIAGDAVPELNGVPFTVSAAAPLVVVGVTVTEVIVLATASV